MAMIVSMRAAGGLRRTGSLRTREPPFPPGRLTSERGNWRQGRNVAEREVPVTTVEYLLDAHAIIAESLLWEPDTGLLYWLDIKRPALYALDPRTLASRRWDLPEHTGAFALLEGGEALVAMRTGLFTLSLQTGNLGLAAAAPFDPALFRFNEGAVDAAGRFWVGCMYDPLDAKKAAKKQKGPLSTWTSSAGLVGQADAAELHNGMAWSPDDATFYLAHSYEHVIYACDFDVAAGRLGAKRDFARLPHGKPLPDGAAVDEEGAYWCAIHGGSCLHRYAPDGTKLRTIELPVTQPTMCAFGGPELRTLYVSSASDQMGWEQRAKEPHAGALLRLDPGVRGIPKACRAR